MNICRACDCDTFMHLRTLLDCGFGVSLWPLAGGEWGCASSRMYEIGETPLEAVEKIYERLMKYGIRGGKI